MPNSKISQLTDGGAAQAADEFVVARGSDNRRIDGASVAAAATSVGTLTGLTVSSTATIGGASIGTPSAGFYQDTSNVVLRAPTSGGIEFQSNAGGATWGEFDSTGLFQTNNRGIVVRNPTTTGTRFTVLFDNGSAGISAQDIAAGADLNGDGTNGVSTSRVRWGHPVSSLASFLSFHTTEANGNDPERMRLDSLGNLGIGTTTFGTSAARVLALGTGTEPSSGPADTVQLYSVDLSAGNTIPAVRCEGTGVTGAGITNTTVTHKIALKVNGTVYYLLATTNNT